MLPHFCLDQRVKKLEKIRIFIRINNNQFTIFDWSTTYKTYTYTLVKFNQQYKNENEFIVDRAKQKRWINHIRNLRYLFIVKCRNIGFWITLYQRHVRVLFNVSSTILWWLQLYKNNNTVTFKVAKQFVLWFVHDIFFFFSSILKLILRSWWTCVCAQEWICSYKTGFILKVNKKKKHLKSILTPFEYLANQFAHT